MLGLFYINAKKDLGWFWAIVALFFLSSMPLLTYHATDAYADLTLAFYSFSAVLCCWNYIKERKKIYLIISSLMLSIGFLTKNEGLFYIVAINIAFLHFSWKAGVGEWKKIIYLCLPLIIFSAPWVLFKLFTGIGYGHSANSSFELFIDPAHPEKPMSYWEPLGVSIKEFVVNSNFNLVFICWITLNIIGFKQRRHIGFLNLILLLIIALFVFIYVFAEPTAALEATGIHRNSLTFMPLMLYSTVLLAKVLWQNRSEI